MKCNAKFLLKIAGALAAVLAVLYWALPEYHAEILALAPLSLAVLCPLSMLMMMWFIQRPDESARRVLPPANQALSSVQSRINEL
ncbi:Protein of unknown function [Burkholderia sp. OK233]|nr:Protein of unknown function [Burkholderia sp. OK233]